MEWVKDLLTLLFGQLGPLGTVCVAAATYSAWLHHTEREDHRKTREMVAKDSEARLKIHNSFIETLAEMKVLLQHMDDRA